MIISKQKLTISLAVATTLSLLACGEAKQADETKQGPTNEEEVEQVLADFNEVQADQPSDSTGADGNVTLNFSTFAPASLALTQTDTIALGNDIVIHDARISIAAIKLKADKQKSEEEELLRAKLKAEKKVFEKEIEAEKKAVEAEIEELKKSFETQKEGLTEEEINTLKEQMKADVGEVKKRMALIEQRKDQKEADLEAQIDKNLKWKGPYLYDLVKGTMTPELPQIETVDGSYQRIEFKAKPNRTAEATDTILNNSIVVSGTYQETPFMISFPVSQKFRLMGAGAFRVDAEGTNMLNVAFSVEKWFEAVDLSTATVELGEIIVSEASNKAIWDAMRKNIKRSTKFGKDEDGDGELSDDENEGDGEEGLEEVETEEQEDEAEEEESGSSSSEGSSEGTSESGEESTEEETEE